MYDGVCRTSFAPARRDHRKGARRAKEPRVRRDRLDRFDESFTSQIFPTPAAKITNYEFCSNDSSAGGATAKLPTSGTMRHDASPLLWRSRRTHTARATRRTSKLESSLTIPRGEHRGRLRGRSRERGVRARISRNNSRDNGLSRRTLTRWVFVSGSAGGTASRARLARPRSRDARRIGICVGAKCRRGRSRLLVRGVIAWGSSGRFARAGSRAGILVARGEQQVAAVAVGNGGSEVRDHGRFRASRARANRE